MTAPDIHTLNRREFLRRGAWAGAATAAALVGYTVGIEPHWLEIVRRDLPVAGLPRELWGATLAQLSDIHVGPQVSDEYLLHSFERLRVLAPDIVVFTGDFLTYRRSRGESQYAQLRDVLAHFPSGRLATIAVLGNHDYGPGWRDARVAKRIVAEAERAGVHVLRNDVHTVAGLDLVGVDDLWAVRADPQRAIARRTGSAAIALCHNPDALDDLRWDGYAGWILAGHTHGGQCKPPFLPPPLLPVKNRRYVSGVVPVRDGQTLYISRGVGHIIRARFNCRPEITVFRMTTAGAAG